MMQPSALNQTFDTSLFDLQRSFSSTESNTSGSCSNENAVPVERIAAYSAEQSVSTNELYNHWAGTYDTDGNVLQAVDSIQMKEMVPKFLRMVESLTLSGEEAASLSLLDLGCGTGRNTVELLQSPVLRGKKKVQICGLDASEAMLEIARGKCDAAINERHLEDVHLSLKKIDFGRIENIPQDFLGAFQGVISTLVLEHLPANLYFTVLSCLLRPGGLAIVTNMHPVMGSQTRAGYKAASGEHIKGVSYVHTIQSTVNAAYDAGFEVVGELHECRIDEGLLETLGKTTGSLVVERGRKWVGVEVWYGMIFRKK